MVRRCVMGRQREQMTLNNPDILFIHLSAARKDAGSLRAEGNEESVRVEDASNKYCTRNIRPPRLSVFSFLDEVSTSERRSLVSIDLLAGQVSER